MKLLPPCVYFRLSICIDHQLLVYRIEIYRYSVIDASKIFRYIERHQERGPSYIDICRSIYTDKNRQAYRCKPIEIYRYK
jgi:hypothetical protein